MFSSFRCVSVFFFSLVLLASINGIFFLVGQIDHGRFGVWSNGLVSIPEMNVF